MLSGNQVIDVEILGATTVPHGVYFEEPVPLEAWKAGNYGPWLDPPAEAIESYLSGGIADSAYWGQDVDANGLLAGYVWFTVSVPTPQGKVGPFTTQVQVSMDLLRADTAIRDQTVTPMLEDAIKELPATAAA